MTKKERLKEILFEVNSGVSLLISDCVQKYGVSARSIQRDVKGLGLSYKEDIILKSQPVDTKKVVIDDNDNTKLPSGNSHGINSRLESHGVGSNPTSHNLHSSKNISHLSHTSSGTGQPISAPLPSIPPFAQELIGIQSAFKYNGLQCTVADAIKVRQMAKQFSMDEDIPPFAIPERISSHYEWLKDRNGVKHKKWKNLYDPYTEELVFEGGWKDDPDGKIEASCKNYVTKQELIINAICNPLVEIMAVEADKRKGKSTAWFVGVCRAVWEGLFKAVGLWASGEENAKGILNDVFSDGISQHKTMPLFKDMGSRVQKIFFNNGVLKAFCNNAASFSGFDFNACVIDEAHEVVVEHKEVFDMIVMTMRAKPQIKLILAMNKGTGPYHLFRKTLTEEFGKEVRFYTIEDADIVHITDKADKKVRTLVKAVGGKSEVDRWLDNKRSLVGSSFNGISLEAAYDTYNSFFAMETPRAAHIVLSYDPSGSGHPSGWWCGACDFKGEHFWELGSGEFQLADSVEEIDTDQGVTSQYIREKLLKTVVGFGVQWFICESNQNGKDLKLEFAMKGKVMGFKSANQNFGDDKNKRGVSRGAMIAAVGNAMDDYCIYLCGKELYSELTIYNPDEHEKTAKFKGDCADAFIHGVYKLMKLAKSSYIKRGTEITVSGF